MYIGIEVSSRHDRMVGRVRNLSLGHYQMLSVRPSEMPKPAKAEKGERRTGAGKPLNTASQNFKSNQTIPISPSRPTKTNTTKLHSPFVFVCL